MLRWCYRKSLSLHVGAVALYSIDPVNAADFSGEIQFLIQHVWERLLDVGRVCLHLKVLHERVGGYGLLRRGSLVIADQWYLANPQFPTY